MNDRDHFAAAALAGLVANGDYSVESTPVLAWMMAEAMLRERGASAEKYSDFRNSQNAKTTDHDAVPAATAPADSHAPRGAVDRESVGTDKAEPLNRDCGTGNTTDRPQPVKDSDFDRSKPIRDARLAALEELAALDQKLELEYGLTGNPMIKAQERTPPPQTTPGECSSPQEGTRA